MSGPESAEKTTFLVTEENPDGWKIEDILMVIQDDMFRRTQKIVGDNRAEARVVLNNNIEILGLLSQCIERAVESTQILDRAFGPPTPKASRVSGLSERRAPFSARLNHAILSPASKGDAFRELSIRRPRRQDHNPDYAG